MNGAKKLTLGVSTLAVVTSAVLIRELGSEPSEAGHLFDLILGLLCLLQLVPLGGFAWLIAGTPPRSIGWRRAWIAWTVTAVPCLLLGLAVTGLILFT